MNTKLFDSAFVWCEELCRSWEGRERGGKNTDQSYAELPSGRCKISYLYAKLHYIFLDIDECSSNAHSCGVNAVCNNTVGSYACACKAGYSGDGRKCTGKAFWSFSKGDLEERDTVNDSCINLFILEYRQQQNQQKKQYYTLLNRN